MNSSNTNLPSQPPTEKVGPSSPSLSFDIIIPAYNASDHIQECLDHILDMSYAPSKVFIIDDGSTDNLLDNIIPHPLINVLQQPVNQGVSHARNVGIDESNAEILLFIDSDVLVPKDLLERLNKLFIERPEVDVAQARYGDKPYYGNLFSEYKHYIFAYRGLNSQTADQEYACYVHTACVAVRRKVVDTVRFDETLSRGEDIDFGQRANQAGYRILSMTDLEVGHNKYYSMAGFTRYQFCSARDQILSLARRVLSKKRQGSSKDTPESSAKSFSSQGTTFYSRQNPIYKMLWLFRPVLSVLLILNILLLVIVKETWLWNLIFLWIAGSFFLEVQFRLYLWRKGSLLINFAAFLLYFYDGLLLALGVLDGLKQIVFFRPQHNI